MLLCTVGCIPVLSELFSALRVEKTSYSSHFLSAFEFIYLFHPTALPD